MPGRVSKLALAAVPQGELAQAGPLGNGADARLASGARLALSGRRRGALVARLVDREVGVRVEGVPPVHNAVTH